MAQIKVNQYSIPDDAIDSQHYAAGSLDTAHIADDQITLAKMAGGTDGNIITYDASGNPAVVATGTSGHFLKSQGAGSVPVFAAAGGGKVLQVVSDYSGTYVESSSTSYIDLSGLSQAITCSATSSKVLIILSLQGMGAIQPSNHQRILLVRDIDGGGYSSPLPGSDAVNELVASSGFRSEAVTLNYLDSPSSTDVVTYKVQANSNSGSWTFNNYNSAGTGSSITLIEIGA